MQAHFVLCNAGVIMFGQPIQSWARYRWALFWSGLLDRLAKVWAAGTVAENIVASRWAT
jgi:hypothetical protein